MTNPDETSVKEAKAAKRAAQREARKEKKKEQELILEAIDYRIQGHSYSTIADTMGLPIERIIRLVYDGLAKLFASDDPEQQYQLDLSRLDAMLASVYTSATQGDRESINAVLHLRRERDELIRKHDRQESFRRLEPVDDDESV